MDSGIILTGGGALINGIEQFIAQRTGIPTAIANNPAQCVAIGTGLALESLSTPMGKYLRKRKA
jgi:rod shape-determining protein MreB